MILNLSQMWVTEKSCSFLSRLSDQDLERQACRACRQEVLRYCSGRNSVDAIKTCGFRFSDGAQNKSAKVAIKGDSLAIRQLRHSYPIIIIII